MPKKLTQEEFITRAKEVHGDKYDYSDATYINNRTKIKIKCNKHVMFYQLPQHHLKGHGCRKCIDKSNVSKSSMIKKQEEFITRAKEVHGDKYDYSDVNYINSYTKVKIKCPSHGMFYQKPNIHLEGSDCKKCASKIIGLKNTLSLEEFITRAKEVHENKYVYEHVNYINSYTKVKIKCPLHGMFYQLPHNHLKGQGCKQCVDYVRGVIAKEKFIEIGKDKECTFYIIKCFNEVEEFYKIGITSRSIKERFNSKTLMPYNYTILKKIKSSASYVWDIENHLKKNLRSFYTPCIKFGGSVGECFSDLKEIEKII